MNNGILLVVSGPAGAGKGTVLKHVMKDDDSYMYSVSATTREPRAGERDGIEYFFISHDEFKKHISDGTMLEYNEYVGNYYGTPKKFVLDAMDSGKTVVLEIDTNGAASVKKIMPDAVTVFICPPAKTELEARLRGRATEDEETILKRLAEANVEVERAAGYDYVIVNENNGAEKAAEILRSIVAAERCKRSKTAALKEFFAK